MVYVEHASVGDLMQNPFFFGGRIENPEFFVGREAELRRIFNALETLHTGQMQHISVVGERRIGKSSLLYHVTQVYPQRLAQPAAYHFAFVDLDNPHCHTRSGLLDYLLDRLGLPHPHRIDLPRFQETIERSQERRDLRLVLCLDEFEHLTRRRDEFPDAFFETLRALGANNHLAFLTASQTSLRALAQRGNLTSPFFNIFQILELGELSPAEARRLAERGLRCEPPFTPREVEQVLALAGGHPAKLQIAGKMLCEAKIEAAASGKPLRRRAWQQAYRRQVEYTFGKPPSRWRKPRGWLKAAARFVFVALPRGLGRFVLELAGRENFSPATAWMAGAGLIVLIALLLLRVLTLEEVQRRIASWVCLLHPGDC